MAAAGALTAVPLGSGVEVRIPEDLISMAESVFRKRDPDFEFIEQPLEINIMGSRSDKTFSRYATSCSIFVDLELS